MAYWNQQEEEENLEGAQPVGSEPPTTGGPTGSSELGAGGGSAPQASAAGQAGATSAKPNTFAGIADYVKANKPQTEKLAGTLSNQVTDLGNQARTSLDSAQTRFNKAVDDNTVNLDENVFNQAKNDTTNFVKDQANVDSFAKMRDATYAGPTDVTTQPYYDLVSQGFKRAQDASNNLKTEAGQRSLVSDLQKQQRGRANQGALELNTALLRGDQGARDQFQGAMAANQDLEGLYSGASQQANDKAAAAKATTEATRNKVQSDFLGAGGVVDSFKTQLENQAKSAQGVTAQTKATQDSFIQGLQTNPLGTYSTLVNNPELRNQLGINESQLQRLGTSIKNAFFWRNDPATQGVINRTYGDTLAGAGGLLNQVSGLNTANASNVATEEDVARDAALAKLMGTSNIIDPTARGQGYSTDLYDFNVDEFLRTLDATRQNAGHGDRFRDADIPTIDGWMHG